jgi:endonuclease/exonuclease/phosphatase family metal-dependent hydrolase
MRVLTYNIHGGVGRSGVPDLELVAKVLEEVGADIVGLQEVDSGRARSGGADQADVLARALGYCYVFSAAQSNPDPGYYGNAILARWPFVSHITLTLPGVSVWRAEPRCAAEGVVATPWGHVSVLSVHLGVRQIERARQTSALLGRMRRAIHEEEERMPLVMLGDLNAGPKSRLLHALGTTLTLARPAGGGSTFPAHCPVLALDHVLVSPPFEVRAAGPYVSPTSREASDHLPFVADLGW